MTHRIVWSFEDGSIEARATCDDDECLNRYVCSDAPCEVYFDVRREPNGTVTHAQWDDDSRQIVERHRMEHSDSCSLLDFLNADPWQLANELNDGHQRFEIGSTVIEPVWQGEDGALWKAVVGSSSSGERS